MLLKICFFFIVFSATNEITKILQDNEFKRVEKISILPEQERPKNPIKFNKDLNVKTLISREITSETMNIKGNIKITSSSNVDNIKVDKLKTENLYVETIDSDNKPLIINGNVVITNNIETEILNTENIIMNGVKQFQLIKSDNFNNNSSGWNFDKINRCNNGKFHLGGYCNLADKEISKTYKLPKHNYVRITANYDMIDNWNGEMGYMKVDDIIAWAKIGKNNRNGINFCGDDKFSDNIGEKIDVILNHSHEEISISFGSTLKGDSCEHSYGISNVMIFTK